MTLEIKTESRGFTRSVSLSGRLDWDTSPKLEAVVTPWLEDPNVSYVVFNLKELNYVSSAGLRIFYIVRNALEARDGSVLVADVQPPVQKVFDIVKALPSASIFRSVKELDDYLDQMQKKVTGELED